MLPDESMVTALPPIPVEEKTAFVPVGSSSSRYRFAVLARLAAGRNDFMAGEDLSPIYLREVSFVKAPPGRMF